MKKIDMHLHLTLRQLPKIGKMNLTSGKNMIYIAWEKIKFSKFWCLERPINLQLEILSHKRLTSGK